MVHESLLTAQEYLIALRLNAPMGESDRQRTNDFVQSSDEADCEKPREYYADNYMRFMRTEWSNARVH
jgi:hypothetical protein